MKLLYTGLSCLALSCGVAAQPLGAAVVVDEAHVTGPDSYRVRDLLKAPNGDLVFIAETEAADSELWVVRTTRTGTPIWSRTFAHPTGGGDVQAQKGAIGADGKIYIVCSIEAPLSESDFYYLELNSLGFTLNERVVDHFANDYQVGDIEVAPDGSVYFAGSGLSTTEQPLLVKMNANLSTQWAYTLGDPAGIGIQKAGDLAIASDGSVVASAVTHDGTQHDVQFVRLDSTGSLVYEKVLGDPNFADDDPHVMLGSDGFTYFTYTRSRFTVNVQARLSQYDDNGVFQWNMQEPGYQNTEFVEALPGSFVFAASEDGGNYSTKYFGFYTDGTVWWNRTMSHATLDFNDLQKLVVDDEDRIYSLSYVSKTTQVDGDWLVANLTNNGVPLYEWTFDTGSGLYDYPAGLQPIGGNEVIVTGFSHAAGSDDTHTFRLAPLLVVNPDSATVRLGRLNAGDLASLESDDDNYYEVCKFIVPNQTVAPVNVEFEGTVTPDYPIRGVLFDTIVKANTPGLQQDTQMWNYLTGSWDASSLTTVTLGETLTTVQGLPDPNVEGVTRRVRSRIRVRQIGPVTVNLWCVQIEKAAWRVTP